MSGFIGRYWTKRSKGENNSKTTNVKHYSSTDGGPPVKIWDANFTYPIDEWELHGWDIPNFHKRVARGDLMPFTPFSVSRRSLKLLTSDYHFQLVSGGHTYEYTTTNPHFSSRYTANSIATTSDAAAYVPSTYDQYVAEAAAKVYGEGHDTLTFLAELASVRGMFTSVMKSLLKLNAPGKFGLFNKMDSKWLSYRYGWRTLVMDIKSLNDAIIGLKGGMQRHNKYAGKDFTTSNSSAWDVGDAPGTHHCIRTDTVTVGIRGSVVADVSIPQFQFNPLQTGWELIPFSFVLDWILNVGRTLAAISFLSLNPSYVAAKGYKVTLKRTFNEYIDTWASGYTSLGGHYMSTECTVELSVRTPCTIPIHPHMNVKLDPYKIIDLIGLFFQRIH